MLCAIYCSICLQKLHGVKQISLDFFLYPENPFLCSGFIKALQCW